MRVTVATLAAVLLAATPARADEVWRWRAQIDEASARFGIPARWIERVMRAESGGKTVLNGKPIRSGAGAMGLMQLMPATWGEMRARLNLGSDPDHPRDNILAGTYYLRLMYDRFGYPGLFGAYNAGPRRYADALAGKARLPQETIAYLGSVAGVGLPSRAVRPPVTEAMRPALFAVRYTMAVDAVAVTPNPRAMALFAIDRTTE